MCIMHMYQYVYDFRADHLVLNHKLGVSSLEKTRSAFSSLIFYSSV